MIQRFHLRSVKKFPRQFQCLYPINSQRRRSSVSALPSIIDILRPNVVEDDAAVADGDGSNAYQNNNETPERWEVPHVPLMDISIDGLTPSQIYGNWASPISYYIRMEEANKGDKPVASLLRYRGPPILPSSEVVYVVHPYLATRLYRKGLAPEDLDQRNYDRICRAFSGDDIEGARILASILHSPANLRAVPSNVADLGTIFTRSHVTGNGPDYRNCWARSTAWAHAEFLKIIEKQYDAVLESIGNAVSLIGADKHRDGEFEERFWAEFEERLANEPLENTSGEDTKN